MNDAGRSDRETVEALLAVAGLAVPEEELAALVENYAAQRAGIELLHRLAGARREDHGLLFPAEPPAQ